MRTTLRKTDWVLINLTITAYQPKEEGAVERQVLAANGEYIEIRDGWYSTRRVVRQIPAPEQTQTKKDKQHV